MTPGQWYVRRGRISRRVFWLHYFLPILGAQIAAGILDVVLGLASTRPESGEGFLFATTSGPIGLVVALALLVPSFASQVTRLHDRGHSAWWLLWIFVPLVGAILLLVQTGFLRGDAGPNRYGPAPGRPVWDPIDA